MKKRHSNANRGRLWEKMLEVHHGIYEARGLAVVFRTPPPMSIIAPLGGGHWRTVLTKEGPPDYTLLMKDDKGNPLPVAAEAKNNADGRWALKNLHRHQAMALKSWDALGGLAVVLLRNEPERMCYALPWHTLGTVWEQWYNNKKIGQRSKSGSASLGIIELRSMGVCFKEGHGYLEALQKCANLRFNVQKVESTSI